MYNWPIVRERRSTMDGVFEICDYGYSDLEELVENSLSENNTFII